jgi:hypothetical protein
MRCDSAVDTPGAYPSSMSAWRTQERTDSRLLASFPTTVPSAYLHPRFQGQEPPGFPGRFREPRPAGLPSVRESYLLTLPHSMGAK